jgi:maltokinase
VTERLVLGSDRIVVLESAGDAWTVIPQRRDGTPARPGDGAAEALLGRLRDERDLGDRWEALRLATVPDVAGEHPITVDQTNTSVVVGDRVIVKWVRSLIDQAQPSLAALAQLDAVGFGRMPTVYAILTWTSPSGRALPVAYVSEYLDGATDGWTWCVDLARAAVGGGHADPWARDFPARLGALAADLHVALATPSHVFPHPIQVAGVGRIQRWHDGAYAMLERALRVADPHVREVVGRHAQAITERFDESLGDAQSLARTPVQHVHGDLHVGQVLRRAEHLAVIDFDGNPIAAATGGVHPAARDVAQLLCSLQHVGQVVMRRDPELDPRAVRAWVPFARKEFLAAYGTTLKHRAMAFLLDERLLPPFELEQELRELVYADVHLPAWSYAPLAALDELLKPGDR